MPGPKTGAFPKRRYLPGMSPLQRRLRYVASLIGVDHATIPASNLVFIRSRSIADYPDFATDRDACLDVHRLILTAVQPKVLWLMGNPEYARPLLDLTDATPLGQKHGGKRVWRSVVVDRKTKLSYRLFHTPHMSQWWRPAEHEDIIRESWEIATQAIRLG